MVQSKCLNRNAPDTQPHKADRLCFAPGNPMKKSSVENRNRKMRYKRLNEFLLTAQRRDEAG